MASKKRTFHFSELEAYFNKIHICESDDNLNLEPNEMKQHKVKADGKTYRSVAAAFKELKLPMHKHQVFRKKLKKEKKAEFEGIMFEID